MLMAIIRRSLSFLAVMAITILPFTHGLFVQLYQHDTTAGTTNNITGNLTTPNGTVSGAINLTTTQDVSNVFHSFPESLIYVFFFLTGNFSGLDAFPDDNL